MDQKLEFVPFKSCVNPSFWHKLKELKLDVYKSKEISCEIWGSYSNLNQTNSLFEVDSTSFNGEYNECKFYFPAHGLLLNKDTIESFKDCSKSHILNSMSKTIHKDIFDGSCIKNPSMLNMFFVLTFADLKKYDFYYWFAFPTPTDVKTQLSKVYSVKNVFDEANLVKLCDEYMKLDVNNKTFFLVKNKNNVEVSTLESIIDAKKTCDAEEYWFAFSDPSSSAKHPGWPLRNYVLFLICHCPVLNGKTIKVLSFRLNNKGSQILCTNSLIFEIALCEFKDNIEVFFKSAWTGYELNERGKMGPRKSQMKDHMSSLSLAESSVDLNLKLMKWRLLPKINLEIVKDSKCLLLGAGTLGCCVARNLLSWGVRTITFVDNGTVSFSNPVRQNLYTYDDSVAMKPKATAAAENLRKIFPGVISSGHQFTIPMPGHPVGPSLKKQTKESVEQLTGLIQQHDVVFLLMDSRESRWLPTLLCANFGKIAINAALGFDTYLVMRHGTLLEYKTNSEDPKIPEGYKCIIGTNLGCYFCNDVTAPGDSLKDRTLDQQCTVTRPGISNIAGALAVELAVSLLQHKDGVSAPAFYTTSKDDLDSREEECVLGILPHSIRGFLSSYSQVLPATERFNKCIACSDKIIEAYRATEFEFLLEVFNSSQHLERVSGLESMLSTFQFCKVWEFSDTDSDADGNNDVCDVNDDISNVI